PIARAQAGERIEDLPEQSDVLGDVLSEIVRVPPEMDHVTLARRALELGHEPPHQEPVEAAALGPPGAQGSCGGDGHEPAFADAGPRRPLPYDGKVGVEEPCAAADPRLRAAGSGPMHPVIEVPAIGEEPELAADGEVVGVALVAGEHDALGRAPDLCP